MDSVIRFHLNGAPIVASGLSPTTTLLNYLRDTRRLVGTKEGCAEGDCGACTVVIVDRNGPTGPSFRAVNACLVLLPLVHGQQVITVEALRGESYHPVQEALVAYLGSQCGYCTPGVIMSMFEACYRRDLDAPWKLDDQMCGNLCRCTGYRPIREATQAIAGTCPKDRFLQVLEQPNALSAGLDYRASGQEFIAPTTWEQLFEALDTRPGARLICGATDLGLDVTKKYTAFASLISLQAIAELARIEVTEDGLQVGATVNLADLEHVCADECPPITRILRYFGARQIKNRATIGGNLCNASPIGDLAPVLLALNATLVARGSKGAREIPIAEFFTGYRKTALQPGEILARIDIPNVAKNTRVGAYKVSRRRELDISAVAAGIAVELDCQGNIAAARIGFGGMAATPARARSVEASLIGKPWAQETFDQAAGLLANDFTPIDDHRSSAWYRRTVAANLIRGFYVDTCEVAQPSLPDRPIGTLTHGGVDRRGEML